MWRWAPALALALAAGLAACKGSVTDSGPSPSTAKVHVGSDVSGTSIAVIEVEVQAGAGAAPDTFLLPVTAGTASRCVVLPIGVSLAITLRGRNSTGVETHRADLSLTVQSGTPVMASATLAPLQGGASVQAILSSTILTVAPRADTLEVGASAQLSASLADCDGGAATGSIQWVSTNTRVAIVDGSGRVTALDTGRAEIEARHQLLEATTAIRVVPPAPPALQLVAQGLEGPVYVTTPPGDTSRLFIVEQSGRIRIIRSGTLLAQPFLDIRGLVTFGGEQGLLSMAFHPSYVQNGYFYVDYTDLNGDTRVVRYRVSTNPDVADPGSAFQILFVEQPRPVHNGGLLLFGPDGMLYVGMGDGGGPGSPVVDAQDRNTLLAKILRIDVDGGSPYRVPPDNPFVGDPSARPETWVYGLRNPWRFSFDRTTGDLYIGDVGERDWEEIDVQTATSNGGENYGWDIMEGTHCYNPAVGCDPTGLVLPVHEYSQADGGCAVIGGYVYRGSRVTALAGHYLYSDLCTGWVRSFRYSGGQAADHRDWTGALGSVPDVSSFGEDNRGELYITTLDGRVFRIVRGGG